MTEIFLPVGGASHLEKAAPEQTAEQLFLTLLARFTRQGRNVSDKAASHGYALFRRVLATHNWLQQRATNGG